MHARTLAKLGGSGVLEAAGDGVPATALFFASRDRARAEEYRRRLDGAGAFGSYEDALADERIEAVLIATPPQSHMELALRALEAGKHVIVEKPPFLRSVDFDVVGASARRADRQVMVAENYVYKPLLRELNELLEAGVIGDVHFIHINAIKHQQTGGWRDDIALAGGGAMFEGGIHWVSFLSNLSLPLRRVTGYRAGPRAGEGEGEGEREGEGDREPERSMLAVLEYEGGAVGTLSYSWRIRSTFRGLRLSRIYGSAGSISFESNGLFLMVRGRRFRVALPGVRDMLGYRAMFRDFLDCIARNRPSRYTIDLARRDLRLVEDIYCSALRSTDH